MSAALRGERLSRTFATATGDVHACVDIDIEVAPGELVVVRGASGAGKTTLLNMLGGLDRPTSGRVWIGDVDATALDEEALAALRRERLGFVFQSFGLIPILSAAENVELPLRIVKTPPAERDRRVAEALRLVGLAGHAVQRPGELSGGQQQRVGIARAIAAQPHVLIADEPTGQLDSRTAATVMDLIGDLVHSQGLAALVSTHDPLLVQRADRVIELHDGRVTSVAGAGAGAGATAPSGAGVAPAGGAAAAPDTAPPSEGAALSGGAAPSAPGADGTPGPRTRAEARAQRDA